MAETNLFGGKNSEGLYTPMSETEQEALSRIAEKGEFVVKVANIGSVKIDKVIIGDHNLKFPMTITFNVRGGGVKSVPYLDLELHTTTGLFLYKDRQPFLDTQGNPLMVSTGMSIPMIWGIGVNQIDPEIVKAVLPKHLGLTTRRGNEKLTTTQRNVLSDLRKGEQEAKKSTKIIVDESIRKSQTST